MRNIKQHITHLLASMAVCLAMLTPTVAHAQDDAQATLAAIDTIVRIYGHHKDVIDPYIEDIYKRHKNDPAMAVGISKAYYSFVWPRKSDPFSTEQLMVMFHNRDSANAYKYIRLALEVDPNYVPAYVHGGDIERTNYNIDLALDWYRRAIAANKADPRGYIAYADCAADNNREDEAVRVLEGLEDYNPEYPVALEMARLYYKRLNMAKAFEFFEKVDSTKLTDDDLVSYAFSGYIDAKYARSLAVSKRGLESKPRSAVFNRLALYNLNSLGENAEGVKYGDRLFNEADSVIFRYQDHSNYASVLFGNGDYLRAIEQLRLVIASEDAPAGDKRISEGKIVDAYKLNKNYDLAEATAKEIIAKRDADGILQFADMTALANIFIEQGDTAKARSDQAGFERMYNRADSVYAIMAQKFPAYADIAIYYRLVLAFQIDPELYDGLGLERAHELIATVEAMGDMTSGAKSRLLFGYEYLGRYQLFVKKDIRKAKTYFARMLEIDPNNAIANQVMTAYARY